eukprot:jgi/Bigna1/137169/aug1.37_g11877
MPNLEAIVSQSSGDKKAVDKEYEKLMDQLGLRSKEQAKDISKTATDVDDDYLNKFINFGQEKRKGAAKDANNSQSIAEYWSRLEKKKRQAKENQGPNLQSARRARTRGKAAHKRSHSHSILKSPSSDNAAQTARKKNAVQGVRSRKNTTSAASRRGGVLLRRPPLPVKPTDSPAAKKTSKRRRTASISSSPATKNRRRNLTTTGKSEPGSLQNQRPTIHRRAASVSLSASPSRARTRLQQRQQKKTKKVKESGNVRARTANQRRTSSGVKRPPMHPLIPPSTKPSPASKSSSTAAAATTVSSRRGAGSSSSSSKSSTSWRTSARVFTRKGSALKKKKKTDGIKRSAEARTVSPNVTMR